MHKYNKKQHNIAHNTVQMQYCVNFTSILQRKKEMKKLEKELQETEAVQSQEKKARLVCEETNR